MNGYYDLLKNYQNLGTWKRANNKEPAIEKENQ
jgi:hypothetical protein